MERRSVFDVHLNDAAFWRGVPAAVWRYRLGGYEVLKKAFLPRTPHPRP